MTFSGTKPRQRATDDTVDFDRITVGTPVVDSFDTGTLTPTAKSELEIAFALEYHQQKLEGIVTQDQYLRLEAQDGPASVFYRIEFVKE